MTPRGLRTLYGNRFANEGDGRRDLWRVLTNDFFQKCVPQDGVVVGIAAGRCGFVSNIVAGTRIAVDLNPDVTTRAAADVRAIVALSDAIAGVEDRSVDRCSSATSSSASPRATILSTSPGARRILRPDSELLILQPNSRYCAKEYWMFFDRITPIDDRALVEALNLSSFDVECLPSTTTLVGLCFRMPLAWWLLGAQSFVVAPPSGQGIVGQG